MREQKANDNGFPVVGKQVKEQQIFPFEQLVEYDGAANKITINANVTINGDTNIGELDIDSGSAAEGETLLADGEGGASWGLPKQLDTDGATAGYILSAGENGKSIWIAANFSGSPKGVYATLNDLQAAYPTGAEGIYVVQADGHWYYWNGSAWTDGGVYLSTGDAVTHDENQLKDSNGNNIYPELEDDSIVRNKLKFYTIEANNLLNDTIFEIEKKLNYGWSGTLNDWTTYSDGRYTYMWIKVDYNTRYWGNPLAIYLFNSNKEYISTLDGIANVFKNFDIPNNANIYYACVMYPAITTEPLFRKTSVAIDDKVYDDELTLQPKNFNISTRCKRVVSYDEIVDFSNAVGSTGVTIKNDNKTYFSKSSKLCYATKTSGVSSYTVTKTARIENWKSMTFVFYIPYETWLGNTVNSGYIQGYINGNINYGWYFNGRYKWGWNFIKIRKSDIPNAPTYVTSITITLNPRDSVTDNSNFGFITLDSVVFNLKMKPCVLLNFDHVYQESIDNGGYDLLFNNNIKFSIFTHGFNNLSNSYKELIRKAIDDHNCELGSYGGANSNNTIINDDNSSYLQKYNDMMSLRSEFYEVFYGENKSYASSQAKLTPKMERAILDSNFKLIRALSGLPMAYFDNNCNWITHIEFSQMTYNQIKALIDDAIEYGDCLPLFTHGIANDENSGISSTSIPLSIMTQVVTYLSSKISNGEIETLTFDEFYHSCID